MMMMSGGACRDMGYLASFEKRVLAAFSHNFCHIL
jgi:hypothetical protein